MSDGQNWLQWPAMAINVAGAWLVASHLARRRKSGFWLYMGSNVLWIAWGLHTQAYAVVVLQLILAATNIRGERGNAEQLRVEAKAA